MTKFNKYFVTDGINKAKVYYSYSPATATVSGREMITIYARESDQLKGLFDEIENDSDVMTDYFESDRVRIFPNDSRFQPLLSKMKEWGCIR